MNRSTTQGYGQDIPESVQRKSILPKCKQNNFTHFALITFYLQKTSFISHIGPSERWCVFSGARSLKEMRTDTGNYPRFVELTNQLLLQH